MCVRFQICSTCVVCVIVAASVKAVKPVVMEVDVGADHVIA